VDGERWFVVSGKQRERLKVVRSTSDHAICTTGASGNAMMRDPIVTFHILQTSENKVCGIRMKSLTETMHMQVKFCSIGRSPPADEIIIITLATRSIRKRESTLVRQ
jgi:hypothetical protein